MKGLMSPTLQQMALPVWAFALLMASSRILADNDGSQNWKFDVSSKSEAYQKAKSNGVGFNDDGSEVSE
jgi:hypothetical protein